jgi:hypothetical protein
VTLGKSGLRIGQVKLTGTAWVNSRWEHGIFLCTTQKVKVTIDEVEKVKLKAAASG